VTFYKVGGLLVRRWKPHRRGISLEVWDGDGWVPYSNLDEVLRHGHRLTDAQALALLHTTFDRTPTAGRLSDKEARAALCAPGKLA